MGYPVVGNSPLKITFPTQPAILVYVEGWPGNVYARRDSVDRPALRSPTGRTELPTDYGRAYNSRTGALAADQRGLQNIYNGLDARAEISQRAGGLIAPRPAPNFRVGANTTRGCGGRGVSTATIFVAAAPVFNAGGFRTATPMAAATLAEVGELEEVTVEVGGMVVVEAAGTAKLQFFDDCAPTTFDASAPQG